MTTYINQLPYTTQLYVWELLIEAGLKGEDMRNALDSRLSDLSDTIDVKLVESFNNAVMSFYEEEEN